MAVFSYNDDLDANRDKVRFWLQDTVKSKGPKPSNGNFSDQEIDGLITIEETWQRAVAAGFEVLASAWAKEGSFSVFNGQFTKSTASSYYMQMAKQWRDDYGADDIATAGLGSKQTDFSGDTVTPLFQREAFGHKVTDWDPE
jgi:hypothetical protein